MTTGFTGHSKPAQNRQEFIILSPARSGSTALRMALNNHYQICCHGEVLGRNRVLGYVNPSQDESHEYLKSIRTENLQKFLQKHVLGKQADAVGFKLLYYQVGEIQFAEAIKLLCMKPDLKIIHLWRRNLVARFLSEYSHNSRARQKHQNGMELPSAYVPISRVSQDCRNQIITAQRMAQLFSRDKMLCIEYEDLVAFENRAFMKIAEFLNISTVQYPSLPSSNHAPAHDERTYPDNLQEIQASPDLCEYTNVAHPIG